MKHISEILSSTNVRFQKSRQLSLFSHTAEKGSREWASLDPIRGDRVFSHRSTIPQKPIAVRERGNVLRIVYPAAYSSRHA